MALEGGDIDLAEEAVAEFLALNAGALNRDEVAGTRRHAYPLLEGRQGHTRYFNDQRGVAKHFSLAITRLKGEGVGCGRFLVGADVIVDRHVRRLRAKRLHL